MTGSPLQGGARRRRPQRLALALGLLLAVAAVALGLLGGDDDPGSGAPGSGASPGGTRELRDPDPLLDTAPGIDLGGVDSFGLRFRKPPRAGLVFDLDSGEVLWRRNPVERQPVASLTKVMTALLVVARTQPGERVRVPAAALHYRGSGVGVLKRGRSVPLNGLLHGLLLPSGNDAAIALAVHVSGSEQRFVRLMNRRAGRLGLRCTRFVDPHGLSAGNRSCAADLASLSRVAMGKPRIARIVRRRTAVVPFPIKGGRLYVNSTNPLLRERYRGTIGLKTGYTRRAGRCLVAIVRRGARTLGVVLIGSPDTGRQARKLLGRAWASA
jgi:serine-type D-Ala-D-Ala carboxypeptidase (penicillin-binding protein 5/6)